jgi:hypothetical protein
MAFLIVASWNCAHQSNGLTKHFGRHDIWRILTSDGVTEIAVSNSTKAAKLHSFYPRRFFIRLICAEGFGADFGCNFCELLRLVYPIDRKIFRISANKFIRNSSLHLSALTTIERNFTI